jgi:hypothetical protein
MALKGNLLKLEGNSQLNWAPPFDCLFLPTYSVFGFFTLGPKQFFFRNASPYFQLHSPILRLQKAKTFRKNLVFAFGMTCPDPSGKSQPRS